MVGPWAAPLNPCQTIQVRRVRGDGHSSMVGYHSLEICLHARRQDDLRFFENNARSNDDVVGFDRVKGQSSN